MNESLGFPLHTCGRYLVFKLRYIEGRLQKSDLRHIFVVKVSTVSVNFLCTGDLVTYELMLQQFKRATI